MAGKSIAPTMANADVPGGFGGGCGETDELPGVGETPLQLFGPKVPEHA